MQRETLEVEFVTPCFLRGSTDGGAEWRAASVRGQFRWWLRAAAGGDLAAVRAAERDLFGDTDRGSMVRIRTRPGRDLVSSDIPFEAPAGLAGVGAEDLECRHGVLIPPGRQRHFVNPTVLIRAIPS